MDQDEEATHELSVALRHRQIPSRLRKFLCLKPGSSLSQTYCGEEEEERERVRSVCVCQKQQRKVCARQLIRGV